MIYCICAILVLSFFSSCIPSSNANPDIGISMAGPLMNASFQVVAGQEIESYVMIKVLGSSEINLGFDSEIVSGAESSVKITQPEDLSISPDTSILANWSFIISDNASDFIQVMIRAEAIGKSNDSSVVTASVVGYVYFILDNNTYSIRTRVLDGYGWPVENVEVELTKGFQSYVAQRTDVNGTTRFILAGGLYTLRLYLNGIQAKQATLNVSENRLFTFIIRRQVVSLASPYQFPIIECSIFFLVGYCIRYRDKAKKREDFDESLLLQIDIEEWIAWSRADEE